MAAAALAPERLKPSDVPNDIFAFSNIAEQATKASAKDKAAKIRLCLSEGMDHLLAEVDKHNKKNGSKIKIVGEPVIAVNLPHQTEGRRHRQVMIYVEVQPEKGAKEGKQSLLVVQLDSRGTLSGGVTSTAQKGQVIRDYMQGISYGEKPHAWRQGEDAGATTFSEAISNSVISVTPEVKEISSDRTLAGIAAKLGRAGMKIPKGQVSHNQQLIIQAWRLAACEVYKDDAVTREQRLNSQFHIGSSDRNTQLTKGIRQSTKDPLSRVEAQAFFRHLTALTDAALVSQKNITESEFETAPFDLCPDDNARHAVNRKAITDVLEKWVNLQSPKP